MESSRTVHAQNVGTPRIRILSGYGYYPDTMMLSGYYPDTAHAQTMRHDSVHAQAMRYDSQLRATRHMR
eukprot:6432510-Prymnesium_polylepis.1